MKNYVFQYRREQRFEEIFPAESEKEAREAAEAWMNSGVQLIDCSDDRGELELLEVQDCVPMAVIHARGAGVANCLDLSTAHMPNSSPRWRGLRAVAHEHGFTVFVSSEPIGEEPDWAMRVLEYARANNCILINFDQDGEVLDFLPKWEW